MIYEVRIVAPAINETVILSATSESEAKSLALESTYGRWRDQAAVTVEIAPEEPPAA